MTTHDGHLLLEGKRALITAAGSGMGRAAAILFARQGAELILVDVDEEAAASCAEDIARIGGSADVRSTDLTDREDIDRLLDGVTADYDRLDVLYNHAGLRGPLGIDFDFESWNQCVTINLWAPTVITQRLLPLLRESPAASIIFTSSQAGLVGVADRPTYATTKAGIIQFMRSLALSLAPEGIRANAISPGATDTAVMRTHGDEVMKLVAQSIPMRRIGMAEEVAQVALFLASSQSSYVTGITVPVDGGAVA